jgi:hypothetical protein
VLFAFWYGITPLYIVLLFSFSEIERYYQQGIGALIAEAVNAKFNKISFMVETDTDSANVKLIRNTNEYVLICDGFWGNPKGVVLDRLDTGIKLYYSQTSQTILSER